MAEAPAEDGGAEVRVEECDVVPCEGAGVRVHGGGEPAPALAPGPAPPPGHAPPVAAQPGDVLPEGAEPPHLGPPRQPVQAPAPEPGLGHLPGHVGILSSVFTGYVYILVPQID